MQKPILPPQTGNDTSSKFWQELEAKLAPLEDGYLHWDDLQHKTMPVQGINHKQWWQLLKAKRRARLQTLPFHFNGQPCYWVLDDELLKLLTQVERKLSLELPRQFTDILPADNFIAEAVASCEFAGVDVESDVALDLLASGRPATTSAESACESLHSALTSLPTNLKEETLLKLNQDILNEKNATWRNTNSTIEYQGETLFNVPDVPGLNERIKAVVDFANINPQQHQKYMHPILQAIILHYMLLIESPFTAANTRTARALFHAQMLGAGYHFVPKLALSKVLHNNSDAFYRAILLTQTDANDLTYFIMQQLQSLLTAIENFEQEQQQKQNLMQQLPDKLTLRQKHILSEMQQHPGRAYRLARYQQRMQITYETSRTDLMKLAKQGLASREKIGKAFVYCAAK